MWNATARLVEVRPQHEYVAWPARVPVERVGAKGFEGTVDVDSASLQGSPCFRATLLSGGARTQLRLDSLIPEHSEQDGSSGSPAAAGVPASAEFVLMTASPPPRVASAKARGTLIG